MKRFCPEIEISEICSSLSDDFTRIHIIEPNVNNLRSLTSGKPCHDFLWRIAIESGRRADWHACRALIESKRNMNDLTRNWSTYILYKWIYFYVGVREIETGNGGQLIWTDAHLSFVAFLAFNELDKSIYTGNVIYQSIQRNLHESPRFSLIEISESKLDTPISCADDSSNINTSGVYAYSESPLCGMNLRLWSIIANNHNPIEPLDQKFPQCGIYENLFVNWNNLGKLAQSISDACDFHMKRMKPDRRIHHDIPEFETTPFRQIPFEILAYRSVRTKMGLETPWPTHPLLDSPFVKNLPEELPPSDDPLLNDVLTAVRKVISEI